MYDYVFFFKLKCIHAKLEVCKIIKPRFSKPTTPENNRFHYRQVLDLRSSNKSLSWRYLTVRIASDAWISSTLTSAFAVSLRFWLCHNSLDSMDYTVNLHWNVDIAFFLLLPRRRPFKIILGRLALCEYFSHFILLLSSRYSVFNSFIYFYAFCPIISHVWLDYYVYKQFMSHG